MNVDVAYMDSQSWDEQAMRERTRWLREHDPVRWSEKDGVWLVTRFEDVVHVSKHQEIFTSGEGVRPGNATKIGLIDEEEPRPRSATRNGEQGIHPPHGEEAGGGLHAHHDGGHRRRRRQGRVRLRREHRRAPAAATHRRDDRHPRRGLRPVPSLVGCDDRSRGTDGRRRHHGAGQPGVHRVRRLHHADHRGSPPEPPGRPSSASWPGRRKRDSCAPTTKKNTTVSTARARSSSRTTS